MSMDNSDLNLAKSGRKDDFYTREEEILKELNGNQYAGCLKNKTVLCPCNDGTESSFVKVLSRNFGGLGIQKLIAISYGNNAYKLTKTAGARKTELLKGDGDFRSDEVAGLIDESDVIITNPPFSLFVSFISMLMEKHKKFLVFGNINDLITKPIFPYVRDGKIWLGHSIHSGDRPFYVSDTYPLRAAGYGHDKNGKLYIRVKGVRWITNLGEPPKNEPLNLTAHYKGNEELYPVFENYNAINVNHTEDIPCDFFGQMGVPISFLDKFCREQFKIIGYEGTLVKESAFYLKDSISGKTKKSFTRLIVERRSEDVAS